MGFLKFFTIIFATLDLTSQGFALTIDNQLVIIANDCYTRIAIGSILPSKDISASVTAATVTECEDECSRKRNTCEIFSFGISSKGNATCLLGNRVPNADELVSNSDYDIYIRQQSSPNCLPDRLYKLGSGNRNPTNYNDDNEKKDGRDNETSRGSTTKPGKNPGGYFGTVSSPNAEKIPVVNIGGNRGNDYQNNNYNYPSYQVAEEAPNFTNNNYNDREKMPNSGIFDDDNPNPQFIHGNKNHHGIIHNGYAAGVQSTGNHNKNQGNQNFNPVYQPENIQNFYPQTEYQNNENGNQEDYRPHGFIEYGNRYGINVYEAPDTVCKLIHDF